MQTLHSLHCQAVRTVGRKRQNVNDGKYAKITNRLTSRTATQSDTGAVVMFPAGNAKQLLENMKLKIQFAFDNDEPDYYLIAHVGWRTTDGTLGVDRAGHYGSLVYMVRAM